MKPERKMKSIDEIPTPEPLDKCPFCEHEVYMRCFTTMDTPDGKLVNVRKTPQVWCSNCGINFIINDPYENFDEYVEKTTKAWNRRPNK